MLCCLGLLAGFAIGSLLGGPWGFIFPAIGFGTGIMVDTRLMRIRPDHRNHAGFCCRGQHAGSGNSEKSTKDPICDIQLDEEITTHKAEFDGKTYFFCSSACESAFRENPKRYIK